jgi:GNAT superfamily N-acetyltransferase
MKISTRRADKDDAKYLRILVSSLSHLYLSQDNLNLPQWFLTSIGLEQFAARLESAEFTNIVAEIDNCIVGYISIQENKHLYHLFVSQKCQGKGIARQLWIEAQKTCSSSKYTVNSSTYAIPVYEKFGFVAVGSTREKDGIKYQLMEFTI